MLHSEYFWRKSEPSGLFQICAQSSLTVSGSFSARPPLVWCSQISKMAKDPVRSPITWAARSSSLAQLSIPHLVQKKHSVKQALSQHSNLDLWLEAEQTLTCRHATYYQSSFPYDPNAPARPNRQSDPRESEYDQRSQFGVPVVSSNTSMTQREQGYRWRSSYRGSAEVS